MAGMTGLTTGVLNAVIAGTGYDVNALNSNAEMLASVQAAMPWVFIGGETICYLGIFIFFLFMGVEKFSKIDHIAIVADQKAAAKAEGREYISAEEKIRREEGEEAYQAELKKQADAAAKEKARVAKLSSEQKKAEAERDAKIAEEFNAMRKAAGKSAVQI